MAKEIWIIVVTLLAVGLIVLLLAYRRYRKLRAQAVEKFLSAIAKIRKLRKGLRATLKGGNAYSKYTAEPYRKEVQEFLLVARQATTTVLFVSNERLNLIHLIPQRPKNILIALLVDVFIWPHTWRKLRPQIEQLDKYLSEPQHDLELVGNALEQLKNLPWKTALWARDIRNKVREAAGILESLYRSKVHGKMISDAVSRLKGVLFDLKNIPENYFSASKTEILSIPNRIDLTIIVHSILSRINDASKKLLDEVRHWKKVYLDSGQDIEKLYALLLSLKDAFSKVPLVIDLSKQKAQFKNLIGEFRLLRTEYSQPTLEMLKSLGERGQLRAEQSQKLLELVSRVSNAYAEFCAVMENIDTRIKELERELYYHEHRPDYPMIWSIFPQSLQQLSLAYNQINNINCLRTIEELDADGSLVNSLSADLKELEVLFQDKISKAHTLRERWAHCQGIFTPDWMEKVERLVVEVVEYDFGNWEKSDRVNDLQNDAATLLMRKKEILPIDSAQKIDEQCLGTLLGEIIEFATEVDNFEQRKDRIVQRLREVKKEEREAKKVIETLLPTMQIFVAHLGQNKLPLQYANQFVEIGIRGQQLSNEITQPKIGNVFSKAKNISDWKAQVFQIGQDLVDELQSSIEEKQNNLKSMLAEITEYAKEIYDEVVQQAQRYQPVNVYGFVVELQQKREEKPPIQLLYDEIMPLIDMYGNVSTCEQSLEINIADLREQYNSVYDLLEQAEEKWGEAAQIFDRNWPPLIEEIDLDEDADAINDVKKMLKQLKSRKQSLRNLEHEYYQIKTKITEVLSSIENKVARDQREQRKFKTLESGAKKRFEQRIEDIRNKNSNLTWSEIESLRQKANRIIETVKRSYREESLSSDEIAYALNELFKPTNTIIDMSQNVRINDIRLSDGSYLNLSQSR